MQMQRKNVDQVVLDVTTLEGNILQNILNEVSHGFEIPNFVECIGTDLDRVEQLLVKVRQSGQQLALTFSELRIINNAINEIIREFDSTSEFISRIGASPEEVIGLHYAIYDLRYAT